MSTSPTWDYERSPKIEVTKSQLDRLAQDETYIESFFDWMNKRLQETYQTDMVTGKVIPLDSTIKNLQPKPDNLVSRIVGENLFDTVTAFFSSPEKAFVVTIHDRETMEKVEWIRRNVLYVLMDLVHGNLEHFSLEKRLNEAYQEIKASTKSSAEELEKLNEVLNLIHRIDVKGENIENDRWSQVFNDAKIDGGKFPKTRVLARSMDFRLRQNNNLDEILRRLENPDSNTNKLVSEVKDLIKIQALDADELKNIATKFTSDKQFFFPSTCIEEIDTILRDIVELIESKDRPSEGIKSRLMSMYRGKLRRIRDGKTTIYKNLLQLFESSSEHMFAATLREEYIPKLQNLVTYSSFLVSNWQSFMQMLDVIRTKLDNIDPKATRYETFKPKLNTIERFEEKINQETKKIETEKACCYNRLVSIFSDVQNKIGATSLGGSFPDRLKSMYLRLWGSLQHVVEKDEVDKRVFFKDTLDALKEVVTKIQDATDKIDKQKTDIASQLQILNATWDKIESLIEGYLHVIDNDQQTLPTLLDNQVFEIEKVTSLLPTCRNGEPSDTVSKLTYKIYTMHLFFVNLMNATCKLKTDLKSNTKKFVSQSRGPVAKRASVQNLIHEIQYRESYIAGKFKTNASYAAAFQIICDCIVRLSTRYFCVGAVNEYDQRFCIDFSISDPLNAPVSPITFDRLPDISNYVLYMKQFVDANNRDRKTSSFKLDFFKMLYSQFLSNFHRIDTGVAKKTDIPFLSQLFRISPNVSECALELIGQNGVDTDIFEKIRSTSPYKQLLSQYSYDAMVQSWSIEALTETDFIRLMRVAMDFFDMVQMFYDSIFKRKGSIFENSTKSSLVRNFVVSNLISVVRSVTPDWYTDDACMDIVAKMVFDKSGRTVRLRTLVGDVKKMYRTIRKAGGSLQSDAIAKHYVADSLLNIDDWINDGGKGLLSTNHHAHFKLILAKVFQNDNHLLDFVFDDGEDVTAEVEQDIITKLRSGLIHKPSSPDEYISAVSTILEKDYEVSPNLILRRQQRSSSDIVKKIPLFKSL